MTDAGGEARPAGDRPRTWAAFAPWLLLALACVVALPGLADVYNPSLCENEAFARGATGWGGTDGSVVPPAQSCQLTFQDGSTLIVEHQTWLPVPAIALAFMVTVVGLVRPPSAEWRRAALVACVPGLLGALGLAFLLADNRTIPHAVGQVAFATLAFLVIALLPAIITAVFVREGRRVRMFATAWAGWAAAIGLLTVVL